MELRCVVKSDYILHAIKMGNLLECVSLPPNVQDIQFTVT